MTKDVSDDGANVLSLRHILGDRRKKSDVFMPRLPFGLEGAREWLQNSNIHQKNGFLGVGEREGMVFCTFLL